MEPKERAWSIAIVTLTVIAFAVRIQSAPNESPGEEVVVADPQSNVSTDIPVSSGVPHATQGSRYQVFADPQAPLARPYVSEMDEPAVYAGAAPELVLSNDAPVEAEPEPDVFIQFADDYTLDDPWGMSDQQVVDEMLAILGPEQQAEFRAMWSNLSSSEKREWLNQARMAFSG